MESASHRLQALHLAKSYGSRAVVKDVSLEVSSGEVVGLLGPNGAGKTSCFYMIVGLQRCEQGRVLLDDRDLTHVPLHRRAQMGLGYLPQEPCVFRKLTVYENIFSILELRGELTESQRRQRADELLEEFQLHAIAHQLGVSLSGGERRRVEIARLLANDPRFILLDEPFAGIDPISVMDIKRIIQQLSAKNIGILITDHNVRETFDICQRAYIVYDGKLLTSGTPEHILSDPNVRKHYLGEEFV